MFTFKWIRTAIILSCLLFVLPGLADVGTGSYDRMEGDYVRPNRRPTPTRNFNSALPKSERLNAYTASRRAKVNSRSRSPRGSANRRINPQDLPYEPHVNRVSPDLSTLNRYSESDGDSGELSALQSDITAPGESSEPVDEMRAEETEGAPVAVEPQMLQENPLVDETQLVYCSRHLREYHWDRNCRMLKGVRPTRLTLKSAKEAKYVECTACGGQRKYIE